MIKWFTRNGVAANLVMGIILFGGMFSLMGPMKVELFPAFSFDTVTARVVFPGGSPEEIEEQIIKKIEEEIQDLEGIKEITSTASEGVGTVTVEVRRNYGVRKMLDDMKARVDAINTFPEEAERPIVEENTIKREVLTLAIYGPMDETSRKVLAEEIREELLLKPNITQVDITGVRDYEISIEVSESALRRHNLTFADVADAVRRTSVDLPGGSIRSEGGEILLRTTGQAYRRPEFEQIVVLTNPDGSYVRLGEVATVVDGFVDEPLEARFNGEPAVFLSVSEVGDQNPLGIADVLKSYVEDKRAELPEGVSIAYFADSTFYLWGRLNMLIENAAIGLVLVMTILTLFLRPSLAFWVTLGIPISFFGAFLLMPPFDITLNLISLFAFILVLGIVVDDAIVVGESVFTEFQRQGAGVEAAIEGARRVAMPVTFAVLTTMVAFTPLLDMPGFLGKFIGDIPRVVILTLAFSLIESKLILPHHLSYCKKVGSGDRERLNRFSRMQRSVADGLERFVKKVYQPFLEFSLRWRYATVAAFAALLLLSVTAVVGGWLKFVPFPAVPSDYIEVSLAFPDGTPEQTTRDALNRIQQALDETIQQSIAEGRNDPVEYVQYMLGQQVGGGGPGGAVSSSVQSHLGSMIVELRKSENRPDEDSAPNLALRWRENLGEIPGAKELVFTATAAGGQGSPVDIELSTRTPREDSLVQLREVANRIKEKLSEYPGVFDIRDTLSDSQKEIKIQIKPGAEVAGLRQADVGSQVRAAFFGEEAQRVQRGREDIKVMVRYPEKERESIGDLENLRIRLPDGTGVPFSDVAEADIGLGYASINRVDRKRVVRVLADADKQSIDLNAILQEMSETHIPAILEDYPEVTFSYGGEAEETSEGLITVARNGLIAVCIMYALLAIPFNSYLQPFIVISVIPFSFVGAAAGHLLLGHSISMLSIFGLVALAGVVVNDSLVLVDFINQEKRKGVPLKDAVRTAGAARFRPILLTSLTTFFGLLPILFEGSLQAQFLIPMAISLSFGIIYATFVTLLLVPSIYVIMEDAKNAVAGAWRWLYGSNQKSPPVAEMS